MHVLRVPAVLLARPLEASGRLLGGTPFLPGVAVVRVPLAPAHRKMDRQLHRGLLLEAAATLIPGRTVR